MASAYGIRLAYLAQIKSCRVSHVNGCAGHFNWIYFNNATV
jgi:hypothetical protein